jgi:hypothetical protein
MKSLRAFLNPAVPWDRPAWLPVALAFLFAVSLAIGQIIR